MNGGKHKRLMRMLVLLLVCSTGGSLSAAEDEEAMQTVIFPLSGSSRDLSRTVANVFSDRGDLQIIPTSGNLMIIRTTPQLRKEVIELMQAIDKPAQTVVTELKLLQATGDLEINSETQSDQIAEMTRSGKLSAIEQIQLSGLENTAQSATYGRTAKRTVATQRVAGREVSNVQMYDVGTAVGLMARVEQSGQIMLDLEFDRSALVDNDSIAVTNMRYKGSLRVKPGESTLVSVGQSTDEAVWLMVTARLGNATVRSSTASGRTTPGGRGGGSFGRSGRTTTRQETTRSSQEAESNERPTRRPTTRSTTRSGAVTNRVPVDVMERYVEMSLQRYDRDKNGKLTDDEIPQSMRNGDANEDGEITAEEIRALLGKMRSDVQASRGTSGSTARSDTASGSGVTNARGGPSSRTIASYADRIMERYDADKDGKLDESEQEKFGRSYSDADKDGDGKLSRQELVEYWSRRSGR